VKGKVANSTGDMASKAHKTHLKVLIENVVKEIK
jgi:hypothetical protein